MSALDKNRVFFGLIHYVLSEQKNVDWIIKSSLIDFTGISSLLEEKPYKTDNILNEIIDYVKSIKPYHVQFSKYFEKYETATEQVNIPKNDWLNNTIKLRFDKIKPTSDILLNYYETVNEEINPIVSFEIIPTPEDSIVTITTDSKYEDDRFNTDEYNINGLIIYSIPNNCFYERKKIHFKNYDTSLWSWVEYDFKPIKGLYFETKTKSYYIFEKIYNNDNYTNHFRKLTNNECQYMLNNHHANRLFSFGLHDNNEISKELDANFKGLEVNGGIFDIGRFGYDIFDYDTSDYDIPTIIYDYCLIDRNENFDKILGTINNYNKEFVIPSTHQFKLLNNEKINLVDVEENSLSLKIKDKNDIISDIVEYSISNGYLDIFTPLGLNKTLYIINEETNDCQVITSYPYMESDLDTIKRKYIIKDELIEKVSSKGEVYGGLEIPNSLDSSKLVVQLKSQSNGKRAPLDSNHYIIKENKFFILNEYILENFDHIIITSFDYKYLYDKIYLWEDKYGRSNNIINLDGNNFLRAIYEKGRPSELVVSQPNNDLFIYKTYQNNNHKIFRNDYKNDMYTKQINLSFCPKINNIVYEDDTELIIKSITLSNLNGLDDKPGKILVNSEIIEYNEINRNTNTISKLKRGSMGSLVNMNALDNHIPYSTTHKIGDIVIPYNDFSSIERKNRYISYNVSDNEETKYVCPSGVKEKSKIYVSKLIKINLLEDVTLNSDKIYINNPNVVNSYETFVKLFNDNNVSINGDYNLKINDDTIPFKTITKINNSKYCIENFTLPSKYNNFSEDSIIYNSKTSFISSSIPMEMKLYNDKTPKLENVTYINEEFVIENENGSLVLDIEEVKSKKKSSEKNYVVKINETDNLYTITGNINTGIMNGYIFNIDGTSFGNIVDNIVIKNDGTIYAKIENSKFITINTVVKLINPNLYINESIKINVVDDEFFFKEEEPIIDNDLVTLTFKTDPSNATLEIDGGDYTAFNNVITVPLGSIVKYKASCKGYYDLEGSVIADETKEVLLTLTKEIIIEDADYIVLRYIWTGGKDLDTDTRFTNITNISEINDNPIGWSRGQSVPTNSELESSVLFWAGDNTGVATEDTPKEENILINIKNLLSNTYYDNLPLDIIAKLSATFYSEYSEKPVKLELIGFKGGEMKYLNYKFYNEGGEQIEIEDNMGIKHNSISLYVSNLSETLRQYNDLATININKNSKQFKLSVYESNS